MKRVRFLFVPIICVIFLYVLFSPTVKYEKSRDTLASFGDGQYQIVRSNESAELYDQETGEILVWDVSKYREVDGDIYIIGANPKYTILNSKTDYVRSYNNFKHMPREINKRFEKLKWDLEM